MTFPDASETPLGALHAPNSSPQRPRNTRPKVIFSYLVNTLRSLDRQNNTPASGGSSRGVITGAGRTAPGRAAQATRFSVCVVSPVVLEDKANRGKEQRKHPYQEKPPSDRGADRRRGRGQAHEQRPPAVRAEEAKFAGAVADLCPRVVLLQRRQPPTAERNVEPGQEGEPDSERKRGRARGDLGEIPRRDVRAAETDR